MNTLVSPTIRIFPRSCSLVLGNSVDSFVVHTADQQFQAKHSSRPWLFDVEVIGGQAGAPKLILCSSL